jgi:hypothetical protein
VKSRLGARVTGRRAGQRFDADNQVATEALLFLGDLDPEAIGPSIAHATHYEPTPVGDFEPLLAHVPFALEGATFVDARRGHGPRGAARRAQAISASRRRRNLARTARDRARQSREVDRSRCAAATCGWSARMRDVSLSARTARRRISTTRSTQACSAPSSTASRPAGRSARSRSSTTPQSNERSSKRIPPSNSSPTIAPAIDERSGRAQTATAPSALATAPASPVQSARSATRPIVRLPTQVATTPLQPYRSSAKPGSVEPKHAPV